MIALQVAGPQPTWSRAAIHDTVAAIVKQSAYRRDVGSTLLDRILQWIGELYTRFVDALGVVPHGRAIATAATVAVVLLILARLFYASRLRGVGAMHRGARRARGTASADPWREAEALSSAGHYTEAAHLLYRATLAWLASKGLVRLHDSKTSGDYARELRRKGDIAYASFRRFGNRYDRIIYGSGVCDAVAYRALLEDAQAVAAIRHNERAA